jgi:tetrahedral aminopeptidase
VELKELLQKLTETYGPSGSEERIRDVIARELTGLVDEQRVDAMGNLIALKRGSGGGLKVMLAAHMDEIGVIVTHVDEKGFLRFQPIGGVYPLTLLGSRAVFANGVVGVFGLEKLDSNQNVPDLDKFYLDVGATSKQDSPVQIGDTAGFFRPLVQSGPRWISKAMDDRSGCAVILEMLRALKSIPHDLYAVFTVQEEVGMRGARTSTFGVDPDLALAVDVTMTGDTPESRTMAVSLGQGPAIKIKDSGMLAHPAVKDLLIQTAEREGIPYQREILERGTTDATAMQLTRSGIPAGVVSIPCRYVHTNSEMVDSGDMENAARLLAAVLSNPISLA